jgi:hypothetical protein
MAKSKEVKTGSNLTTFSKEGYDSNRAVLPVVAAATMTTMITF